MFIVSDSARDELQKVLASDKAKGSSLIIFLQGFG